MAVPNYYVCDICGKPVPKEARLVLLVGYQDNQPINNIVDLCHLCSINVLNFYCRDRSELGTKISQVVNTFKQRQEACHPTKST